MSVILVDGCEDFSSWVTALSPTIVAARNGNGFSMTASTTATANIGTADQTDTVTVGFAIRLPTMPGGASTFLTLKSDAGVTSHGNLRVNPDGSLTYQRAGVNLVTTAVNTIVAATWLYVECTVKLSDTVGTVSIRVNGTVVGSAASVDTKNAGTKTVWDQVQLGASTGTTLMDDLYVSNDATALGDCVVQTLYPNADGTVNQWVGSDGNSVSNYALVNEAGTPVTSTYTGDSVVGHQDLYNLDNLATLPSGGSVYCVCHVVTAQKTDAGAAQFKVVNRRSADTKSATIVPTTTFAAYHYVLATDPETSAAWTTANVNALQAGVEIA